MKIVQIKGGNGSGKTTIVKQLLRLNGTGKDDITKLMWPGRSKGWVCYAIILCNVRWITIGEYHLDRATGGTDCYPCTVNNIKHAIKLAIDNTGHYSIYGIVFEGMMISTIKSTFYEFLLDLEKEDPTIEPLFVILEATPHGCMNRIWKRGTSRKGGPKFENVAGKCIGVIRHALTYNKKYIRWIDVENTWEKDMLGKFLWEVGDKELHGEWDTEVNLHGG